MVPNELKLVIREQGPWILSSLSNLRNYLIYGNRAGPSAEALLTKYGSWEEALETTSRTNPLVDTLVR